MNAEAEVTNMLVGQTIKYTFEGAEVILKLVGKGAKELAILLAALLKDEKKWAGATSLKRMLREGRPMRAIQIPQDRFQEFAVAAKKYGILFNALQQKNKPNGICDIFIKSEDAALVNRVLENTKISCMEIASIDPEVTYKGQTINPTTPEAGDRSAPASGRSTSISVADTINPITATVERPSPAASPETYPGNPVDVQIEYPPSVSATLSSLQADAEKSREPQASVQEPQRRSFLEVLTESQVPTEMAIHEIPITGEPLPINPIEGSDILQELNQVLAESLSHDGVAMRFNPTIREAAYSTDSRVIELPIGIKDTDLFFALATEGFHANMHSLQGSDYRREDIEPLAQFHAQVIAGHCSIPSDRISFDAATYLQSQKEGSAMDLLQGTALSAESINAKIDFHVKSQLKNMPFKGSERSILNER